jgi:hypothetical protein
MPICGLVVSSNIAKPRARRSPRHAGDPSWKTVLPWSREEMVSSTARRESVDAPAHVLPCGGLPDSVMLAWAGMRSVGKPEEVEAGRLHGQ